MTSPDWIPARHLHQGLTEVHLCAASWVAQFNIVPIPCDTPLMVKVKPPGLPTAVGPPTLGLRYI